MIVCHGLKQNRNLLIEFLKHYNIISDEPNSIDELWINKPKISNDLVLIHRIEFAGESCSQKYNKVKEKIPFDKLGGKKSVGLLITRLDDIACKIFE